jgi:DNA-3-methyladenine glycosylase
MTRANARGRSLTRAFYGRDVLTVAPELLHKVLVHDDPAAGRLAMRIVEVEAYLGQHDPASHAYRGPTKRNATMFGPPGHLYVYFTYGMHWCANVVTGPPGVAHAVLLRAGAPVDGIDAMRARRPTSRSDRDLGAGPARLTLALGLTGAHDGLDLTRGPVRIVDDGTPPPAPAWSTRVGLRAGEGDLDEWRCYVAGDPHLSRNNPGRARPRKVG